MDLRIVNGSVVNRIWGDAGTELMAGFQYERDAIGFAELKVQEDAESEMSPCDYAVTCTCSGKMTIIRALPKKKSKAA